MRFVLSSLALTLSAPLVRGDELPILAKHDFETADLSAFEFTDAKAWQRQKDGAGNVLALTKLAAYKPKVRSPLGIAWLKTPSVGDFQLDVRVKSTTRDYPHRDLCVFFGRRDAQHFYYVHFGKAADPHAHSVFIVDGADRKSIASFRTTGTPWTNGWHNLRVKRNVGTGEITVYFDNLDDPIMKAKDRTFVAGTVGIGSFDDLGLFDDLVLRGRPANPTLNAGVVK